MIPKETLWQIPYKTVAKGRKFLYDNLRTDLKDYVTMQGKSIREDK